MTTVTIFEKGDVIFAVELDNTFIGVVTGESFGDVVEIRPIYMKHFVKTTSIWIDQKYIKSCLGRNEATVREDYVEYFI